MNKETAMLAMKFLQRVQLQATEIPAFVTVNQALREFVDLDQPQGDRPETPQAVVSAPEGNGAISQDQDGGD